MKSSEYLTITNYKSVTKRTKRMMSKEEFLKLKTEFNRKKN